MLHAYSVAIGERRLLSLMKEVGPNLKEYGKDVIWEKYLRDPWRRGDNIAKITGPVMATASAILEGTDQIWAGIVDQKLENPTGTLGRLQRTGREMVGNIKEKEPIKFIVNAVRTPVEGILDVGDAIFGLSQSTRASTQKTLAA